MPNIIDVIKHKNAYGYQWFAVLDALPVFTYERIQRKEGVYLLAEDDGFYSAYKYERPGPTWKAFAGREFDLPMKEGGSIHATGEWWFVAPSLLVDAQLSSPAISTIEELSKCYVFTSGCVRSDKFDAWLSVNEPSTDYYKYDPRQALKGTPS